ncbi:unnamed protein product, partial [Ectocarpus sp. 12 AP-2014]
SRSYHLPRRATSPQARRGPGKWTLRSWSWCGRRGTLTARESPGKSISARRHSFGRLVEALSPVHSPFTRCRERRSII